MAFATAETRQPQCLLRPRLMGAAECLETDETSLPSPKKQCSTAGFSLGERFLPFPSGFSRRGAPSFLAGAPGVSVCARVWLAVFVRCLCCLCVGCACPAAGVGPVLALRRSSSGVLFLVVRASGASSGLSSKTHGERRGRRRVRRRGGVAQGMGFPGTSEGRISLGQGW